MLVKTLMLQYARYNQWAHLRLFNLINSLSTDQIHADIPSSFSSLYKTVQHIWSAETLWLARLNQETIRISGDPFEGKMEKLSGSLAETDQKLTDWLERKQDDQLTENLNYTNIAGRSFVQPYDLLLAHIFNHNTYHNGQLVSMLRFSGIEKIPSTDFVVWTRLASASS
jgi:uncharacterized damage-inducible protein DinB